LDRASDYHVRRNDQWLRLQTVFFALVEIARADSAVRATIQPIWDAIQPISSQYEQARDTFVPSAGANGGANFSAVDISPRVLNALETARELAVAVAPDFEGKITVGPLHLAGALISRRVDGDDDFASLGLAPQSLRLDLIKHAQAQGESVEVWREALGEEEILQAGRPVDLNSDEPEAVVRLDEDWKIDPLSIKPDVEAFAALLASKTLEPPLSIGLFGPWGSGKTTFLRRLHRAVGRRASEARQAVTDGQPTPYVSNVVHVDFNAWHFAEDALTSSLVDTILRALSAYIKDDHIIAGTEWSKAKLAELESTKRKLQAAQAVKAAAQTAVTNAETALVTARNNAAEKTTGLQGVLQGVWNTTKSQLLNSDAVRESGVLDELGDTVKSSEDLEARLNSIRNRPARLLNDLGWGRSILFALLVLVVPPLIAWFVGTTRGLTVQVASTMTTMVVLAGGWLRTAARAAGKVDRAIDQIASAYEKQIADDQGVKDAQQKLEQAQATTVTAEASLQAAREALAKAEAEAMNASLPAQMLQLVSNRIEDQTYNKELTTLSLARADLQALSILLRDQRSSAADAPADTAAPRAVDRVIL
jgi:tRNA A37 threonylcarbamoyladenosine biosynthesis protein TsaE